MEGYEVTIPSGTTPEAAALSLLQILARVEQKSFNIWAVSKEHAADRKWVLDAYAECLKAAKGER